MQNRSSRFHLKCTILKRLRTLSLCHNLCVTACIPLWNYCVTVASIFSRSFVSACCLRCLNPWSLFTYTHLTALCPGLPGWAGTRKVKSIWILLKQETVSGSSNSWAACKSAPRCRQITMPAPHHSVFTGRMPFLPPNQQRQRTEGHLEAFFVAAN